MSTSTSTSSTTNARKSMTAIVAATLSNGIGKDGGLPWRLPSEMKYFAKVTTGSASSSSSPNAVIMGRKTWDSIPTKFRPLSNRLNLVISRSPPDLSSYPKTTSHPSLSSALSSIPPSTPKTFLIGGAQLYALALDPSTSPSTLSTDSTSSTTDSTSSTTSTTNPSLSTLSADPTSSTTSTSDPSSSTTDPASSSSSSSSPSQSPLIDRILLTRILEPEYQCDTFLADFTRSPGWVRASLKELQEYIGFEVPGEEGVVLEKGTKYRFEMWVWKG